MLRLARWRRRNDAETGVYCIFVLPDSTEGHWLERPPTPGTRVRSPLGSVWVVADVLQSGRETYSVFCVSRRDYRAALRRRTGTKRDLAAELLEAARQASEAATERRYRRRFRLFRL
jgi:hypothetical protein